ncbi:LOB domain-containing protein 12 [Linum grandiflorum]
MELAISGDKSANSRHKCAACKYQRRRCAEHCALYPYFPTNRTKEFTVAHAVFGVKNMTNILSDINLHVDRQKAVDSLVWEGRAWAEDPVNGPLGLFRKLEREKKELEIQLQLARQHQTTTSLSFGEGLFYGGEYDNVVSHTPVMMNPSEFQTKPEFGGNNISYDFPYYYHQRFGHHQLIPSNNLLHQEQVLPMSIPGYNPSLQAPVILYKDDAIEDTTSTGNQGQ